MSITGGTIQAQNIAGRDIHVGTQISSGALNDVFQPVLEAIRSAPGEKQADAVAQLEALKE